MLLRLAVRDFVTVDRLELDFATGFTVLTGETGAGKSILLDALSLLLGERADAAMVRAGRDRAELSAEFDISGLDEVMAWLDEAGLSGEDGVCFLRRQVESAGRSRGYINGTPATGQQLKALGELLVDIQGQHAHLSLMKSATQRRLVDAFGGLQDLAVEVGRAWRAWQEKARARREFLERAAGLADERRTLEWRREDLDALGFTEEGWQELNAEHARLAHAQSLLEGAQGALECLSERDQPIITEVGGWSSRLEELAGIDPRLKDAAQLLAAAEAELGEVAHALRTYAAGFDLEPGRLTEVEEGISAVLQVCRKYRASPEELPSLIRDTRDRLAALEEMGDGEGLAAAEEAARSAYLERAGKLSARRAEAAADFGARVSATMQGLAMAGGRFEAALLPLPDGGAQGLEDIEFQVALNPGMPMRPLVKTASGGELSRISLSIQVVISRLSAIPTLVFDEVDVGIGGSVAEVVGRLMGELGHARQVLAVTHLPQVAACGDHHLKVEKRVEDETAVSDVRLLTHGERTEEIARMLGGSEITATTRKHAEEMLEGRPR